jgi:asparagine synthase (glutamine-hydrolysing)
MMLAALVDVTAVDALPDLLTDLTGSFAVVKSEPDAVIAITDRIRGVPLYCVDDVDGRLVTDDPAGNVAGLIARRSDWTCQAELLETACVSGADTLVDGVAQVEAGSMMRVPHDRARPRCSTPWYTFRTGQGRARSDDLVTAALAAHRAAVMRAVRYAEGSLIAVPLSGGLDSGTLAAILARSGIDREQVVTFSYGRSGNRESEGSRRVAEALGLRWEFVAYTEQTWQRLARASWWPTYLTRASSLAGVPGFDDLPAVCELRQRGVLDEGTVVVPGHTLDFLAGSQIPGALLRHRRGTRTDAVNAVLSTFYKYRSHGTVAALLGRTEGEVADAMRARAEAALPETPTSVSRRGLVALADLWGWRERQAKMIVNSVRAYEHCGLRWALPWWDREVLDFWSTVPLGGRIGQGLRGELAVAAGWPRATRPRRARVQARLERVIRTSTLDHAAKKLRSLARRSTKASRYRKDELACFALFGESRFRESFHGTEVPRALLAEDVLERFVVSGGTRRR